MTPARFDQITRRLASGASRARSRRQLILAIGAALLVQLRPGVQAQGGGPVPVGGACGMTTDCRQADMQLGAICAENGFTSDGATNCCLERGCCPSDADCCGDRRCAPTGDVCNVCLAPPFPTRYLGQLCVTDEECVAAPSVTIGCVSGRCACLGPADRCSAPSPATPALPPAESAMAAADEFAYLEAAGQFDDLYDRMHPDAQAFIPRAAVVGWFSENVTPGAATPGQSRKVRFIDWSWPVTGVTYPGTAEVAFTQVDAGGRESRDVVRLAPDANGAWHWFFGRDRAFVESQIARFGD